MILKSLKIRILSNRQNCTFLTKYASNSIVHSVRCRLTNEDCERYGKRKHSFWDDPIGDLLSYLCEPRPWVSKVVAITHNAKAFDSLFILNRAIQMKWKPELILNGLKIVCMKIEHMFIDSVSYLLMPLRKVPEAFGHDTTKILVFSLFQ